jgi:hypothetical protein
MARNFYLNKLRSHPRVPQSFPESARLRPAYARVGK